MVGILFDALPVARNRLFLPADCLQHMPLARQCTEVLRIDIERFLKSAQCGIVIAHHCVNRAD